jgi:tRNA G18 (ribose-2'-O)-methylase SpoU
MGSIFRLADAFGVNEIIFGGGTLDLSSNRLRKTARNTHEKVRFRESIQLSIALEELHSQGYTSIAIEITDTSTPLQTLNSRSFKKTAVIVGDENFGISERLLELATFTAHIPMLGNNSSMNVAQALGIALYELTRS